MDIAKILRFKFAEALKDESIKLQDDGEGLYIKKWSIADRYPTDEDWTLWTNELDAHIKNQTNIEVTQEFILKIMFDLVINGKIPDYFVCEAINKYYENNNL